MVEPGAVVRDGMTTRLEHFTTHRNLHSHRVPAHVASDQNEVSCFGVFDEGSDDDLWRIKMYPNGRLRLIHISTDCALHSHSLNHKVVCAVLFHKDPPRQVAVALFSLRE